MPGRDPSPILLGAGMLAFYPKEEQPLAGTEDVRIEFLRKVERAPIEENFLD